MATLLLAARTPCATTTPAGSGIATLTSPSLRSWLRESESWALLFSHPDDFVRYDLEMDRWLVVTRRAFDERRIRPLALASPAQTTDRSWVAQLGGEQTVLLEDPKQQHFGPVDLQAPVLREAIEQAPQRFVMIIDSALRLQKVFNYSTLANLPSPLEFLGWAEALRIKQENAREPQRQVAPARHAYPEAPPVRHHRHRASYAACAPAFRTAAPVVRAIGYGSNYARRP